MELVELAQEIKIPATVVHVISVIFGMGAALVSDLLFSFFGKDKRLNPTELSVLTILKAVVFYSLIGIALSGLIIFLTDIEKYVQSAKFISKMTILLVLLVNGYVLNRYVWPHLLRRQFFIVKKERTMRRVAFVCGAVSVISWLAVCTLGVLDSLAMSYGLIIGLYSSALVAGSLIALLVEKREFD